MANAEPFDLSEPVTPRTRAILAKRLADIVGLPSSRITPRERWIVGDLLFDVIRASDIDVVWVYGYGWPVYRGGPMYYANTVGLDKIVAALRSYQQQTGDDFWQPCSLLLELAEQGKRFE